MTNKRLPLLRILLIAGGALHSAGCFEDAPIDALARPLESDDTATDTELADDSGVGRDTGQTACNPGAEPTWEDPIDQIMQAQCTSCHGETGSYAGIQAWVSNGMLRQYCLMGPSHFLVSGQEYCLRWLDIGAPESDCDVAAK